MDLTAGEKKPPGGRRLGKIGTKIFFNGGEQGSEKRPEKDGSKGKKKKQGKPTAVEERYEGVPRTEASWKELNKDIHALNQETRDT